MESLATEIRNRLGPVPELTEHPLVSIVVLNRDGVDHLGRLMAGLVERTDYPHIELILIDNGSKDGSLEFIRSVEAPFPISIVPNVHNETFSDGCNQGAELAGGELLLFLNNDVQPFERGWLKELVGCLASTGAGAVSSTLIVPKPASAADSDRRYRVQTGRIWLMPGSDGPATDGRGGRWDLFGEEFGVDVEAAIGIGACFLMERATFEEVGGFTHGYFYGGEDNDLFFKLMARDRSFLYSGRSIAIHGNGSTRWKLDRKPADEGVSLDDNHILLARHWAPWVWRKRELDRLSGRGIWTRPGQEDLPGAPSHQEVMAAGFCIRADRPDPTETALLEELKDALASRGHRRLVLRDGEIERQRGYAYDVAIHLRGPSRYAPAPGQANVLWVLPRAGEVSAIECDRYDLVVTNSLECAKRVREEGTRAAVAEVSAEHPVEGLIDAALARVAELGFPGPIRRSS